MKTLNVLFSLLGLLEISGHVRAVGTETSHWFRRKLPKAEQPSEKFDLNNKIKNVVVLVMVKIKTHPFTTGFYIFFYFIFLSFFLSNYIIFYPFSLLYLHF